LRFFACLVFRLLVVQHRTLNDFMFGRTVLLAAKKRNLKAACTHNKDESVTVTIFGEDKQIESFLNVAKQFIKDNKPLNTLGALLTEVIDEASTKGFDQHELNNYSGFLEQDIKQQLEQQKIEHFF